MTLDERFSAFYAAANGGAAPYPWQIRLAEHVASRGRWPDISAPTGAGKSSVIDVHVFLVSEHASGRLDTRPPRRLVLVAPRRVIVDDQFDRAARLAGLLDKAERDDADGPLGTAARALGGLCTSEDDAAPLRVWRLRGGVLRDNGWRLEPAACQVLCATPQMWGSRLLLRGYGATRASRHLEAGLLGHDAVAVVDEAHLHARLIETARTVAARSPAPLELQVVAMSATQARGSGDIGLGGEDLDDPALRRRVFGAKRIQWAAVPDWKRRAQQEVVDRARAVSGRGTVGVFLNDVTTAMNVAQELTSGGATVELVCGRLRSADLERLRRRRPGLLSARGNPEVDFLVSTQSLEVGVDLDLPVMVSALASASALAQRAGRLNRSGRHGQATLTVVVPDDLSEKALNDRMSGPYDPQELIQAASWLQALEDSISPVDVARSPLPSLEPPLLPRLREPDLETLARSSEVQAADPDPDLYLSEPQREVDEVGVVARRCLDLDEEVVRAALIACPPREHEIASLRLGETLDRVAEVVADEAWVVRAAEGDRAALRLSDADGLRRGDVLVVPHGAEVCTAGVVGLDKDAKGGQTRLEDVLAETPEGASADYVVPLAADAVAEIMRDDPVLGSRGGRAALAHVVDHAGRPELALRLRRHRRLTELELTWCGFAGMETTGLLVVHDLRLRAEQNPLVTTDARITVDDHQAAVARRSAALLQALMASLEVADADRLLTAARVHDEGKRHPRFQRRMGADDEPLAKPRPGHVPDRGDGWRHEQLSAAFAAAESGGDPFTVALVAAHHGRGRAMFDRCAAELIDGWDECPPPVREWVDRLYGAFGSYELLRDRAQRDRGFHGLAWWEGLLRAADIQVSREGG